MKWNKPTRVYHGDIIGFGVTEEDLQSEELKKNINNHNIYHLVKANVKPKPNEPIDLTMVRPVNLRPIPRESIATEKEIEERINKQIENETKEKEKQRPPSPSMLLPPSKKRRLNDDSQLSSKKQNEEEGTSVISFFNLFFSKCSNIFFFPARLQGYKVIQRKFLHKCCITNIISSQKFSA